MKLETIGCGVVQWWCCTRSWGRRLERIEGEELYLERKKEKEEY